MKKALLILITLVCEYMCNAQDNFPMPKDKLKAGTETYTFQSKRDFKELVTLFRNYCKSDGFIVTEENIQGYAKEQPCYLIQVTRKGNESEISYGWECDSGMLPVENNNMGCLQTALSNKYDYKIEPVKELVDGEPTITKIIVQIISKTKKVILENIVVGNIGSMVSIGGGYSQCNSARSYVTGFNKNKEVADGDYGDFIVADFNFDGIEDIAIKKEAGSYMGPEYAYYVGEVNGKYKLDKFLTEQVIQFSEPNYNSKTISTTVAVPSKGGWNENLYKYNSVTKKWVLFKSAFHKN